MARPLPGMVPKTAAESRRRTATASWLPAAGLAFLVTAVSASWALRDNASPQWDQGHYLFLSWVYQQALDHHGPIALIRAVYTADPSRAPLLSLLVLPLSYLFGPGPGAGLALNVLLWPVLLLSAGAVAKELFGESARLPTMVVLAPMPLLVWASTTVLQDFLLVTLVTLGVWVLIRTRRFTSRPASLGFGAVVGLGMLAKFDYFVALGGPVIVTLIACAVGIAADARWSGWRAAARVPLTNIGLSLAVAAVPVALWYVPSWGPTYDYLRAQIEPLAGAVSDPLSPRHVASFLLSNGADLSWLAVLLVVAVGLASLPRFVGWLREHIDWSSRVKTLGVAVFVGSWFLIPLFVATANVNQTARYAFTGYPALAVIGGGLIAALRPTVVRYTALTLAVLILLTQTLQANVPGYAPPLLPAFVYLTTPAGAVTINFRGPDGLAGLPVATNYTLTIERYLESVSSEPGHRHRHLTVAILENQADANVNDLGYYARVRDDPFKFKVLYAAASPAALIADLRAYDVALYVRPAAPGSPYAVGQVAVLNQGSAALQMTPAVFRLFRPDPVRLYVGQNAGQSPYLEVLLRR